VGKIKIKIKIKGQRCRLYYIVKCLSWEADQ
jgi:hypothetical protein